MAAAARAGGVVATCDAARPTRRKREPQAWLSSERGMVGAKTFDHRSFGGLLKGGGVSDAVLREVQAMDG